MIAEILLLMAVKPAGWAIVWSVAGTVMVSALAVWRASRIGATASRAA